MATDSVLGLFADPQQYQMQQQQAALQRGVDLAQLDPFQRASAQMYQAGYMGGGALAGALGGQDPQLQAMSTRQQVLKEYDPNTLEGLQGAAKALRDAGDLQGAYALAQKAQEYQVKIDEKQATRDNQLQIAREKVQATIEAAKARGESNERIAQMQIEGRKELAAIAAALKQGQQGNKALGSALQKEEDKDLASIDSLAAQRAVLDIPIQALTADDKGVRALELGPLKNAKYEAQLLAGNSSPQARAYEQLKSAVDTAVNLQVSAEKGVQTDKDVLRFAKALIASYGRNDTQATLDALKRYQNAIVTAENNTKGRLESRRKSQGVGSYYEGTNSGPKANVIKLD
jgi:hypothetical protein